MSDPVSIVVAEDEFFTRQGICSLLAREPGFSVVGEAEGGERAIELVREHRPDVLLLDIRMPPGIDGLEVIRRLREEECQTAIIALTNEKRLIRAVEKAGGNGYIPKDKYPMFIPTVQCVARSNDKIFINPDQSSRFKALEARVARAELSELELEVWRLIAYKNEEIARRLCKAAGRIRNIVTELYFKLDIPKAGDVSQRIQAMELARLYGILEEPKAFREG